ncbi:PREDICTED: uncharacterized protein LOC105363168 [Ceratosolen solmsi marchali]|uniref:Uncharacterized protein LOC105363168 n=1 Tax=Ceratosolen solmsi marchali TaxID=326594 RepID=A0AAJ6YJ95_9HYME|nr:PREDICTED: uncharacterized protein LOC105363168 [Ceratosolen solmsi marchali]
MLPDSRGLILLLSLFTILERSAEIVVAARYKRHVSFRKGSTFFYRLNYKVNSLPHTTIFAQASGFKVAWQLPTGQQSGKARQVSLDDLHEGASLVYESHGFNGKMCLLKSLCQATEYIKERDGVLMKILNLLSGSYGGNGTSILDPLVCRNYANHCPLHLIRFNAFTEH